MARYMGRTRCARGSRPSLHDLDLLVVARKHYAVSGLDNGTFGRADEKLP